MLKRMDESVEDAFLVVNLDTLSAIEPNVLPTGPILAATIDEASDRMLVLTRVPGSIQAFRAWLYKSIAAPHLITSQIYESGDGIVRAGPERDPELFVRPTGTIAFLPPQSLRGLNVTGQIITTERSLPALGFPEDEVVQVVSPEHGSLLVAYSDRSLRLVDGSTGHFLTRLIGGSALDPCASAMASISVGADDTVTLSSEGCSLKRDAPVSEGDITAVLALLPERLGSPVDGLAAEGLILPGAIPASP